MRILNISFHFSDYVSRLASALSHKHVVGAIVGQRNVDAEIASGVFAIQGNTTNVLVLPDHRMTHLAWVQNPLNIWRFVRAFKPDVIHLQETPADYLMAALPILQGYPLVLTVHDHKPHTGADSREQRRKQCYRQYLRRRADQIIVHGQDLRRDWEAVEPEIGARLRVVPHGVLGKLPEAHEQRHCDKVVLFFGRIEAYKGLRYLLDAMDILRARKAGVKLVIAGKGSDLASHIDRIGAQPDIVLMNCFVPANEIEPLFFKAHVVVMPYTDATQSGVAALAIGCGRPVISTDVGSVPEMVRDSYNGLLVAPRDAGQLANAIERLVSDQVLTDQMSANATSLALGEFSWSHVSDKSVEVYERAIESRARR